MQWCRQSWEERGGENLSLLFSDLDVSRGAVTVLVPYYEFFSWLWVLGPRKTLGVARASHEALWSPPVSGGAEARDLL